MDKSIVNAIIFTLNFSVSKCLLLRRDHEKSLKDLFPITQSLFEKEIDHSNFADAVSDILQNVQHFNIHIDPIYRISSLCQFLGAAEFLICWQPLTGSNLWKFYVDFFFTSDFRCIWWQIAVYHLVLHWYSKLVSLLECLRNQRHTVQLQVDPSVHAGLILAAGSQALWLSLN